MIIKSAWAKLFGSGSDFERDWETAHAEPTSLHVEGFKDRFYYDGDSPMSTKFLRMTDDELRFYFNSYPTLKRSVEESSELLDEVLRRLIDKNIYLEDRVNALFALVKSRE